VSLYVSQVHWKEWLYIFCKKTNSQSGCIQTHANIFVEWRAPLCRSSSLKIKIVRAAVNYWYPTHFPFSMYGVNLLKKDARHYWRWLMCMMAPIVLLQWRVYTLSLWRGHALRACSMLYEKRFWTGSAHRWLKGVVSRESPIFLHVQIEALFLAYTNKSTFFCGYK
jgi:hypothetical protein